MAGAAWRYSVEGWDIYDANRRVLHNGDIVRKWWGGGNDKGAQYTCYCFHRLTISRKGKLSISGCSNIITSSELELISSDNEHYREVGRDTFYRIYKDGSVRRGL